MNDYFYTWGYLFGKNNGNDTYPVEKINIDMKEMVDFVLKSEEDNMVIGGNDYGVILVVQNGEIKEFNPHHQINKYFGNDFYFKFKLMLEETKIDNQALSDSDKEKMLKDKYRQLGYDEDECFKNYQKRKAREEAKEAELISEKLSNRSSKVTKIYDKIQGLFEKATEEGIEMPEMTSDWYKENDLFVGENIDIKKTYEVLNKAYIEGVKCKLCNSQTVSNDNVIDVIIDQD